MDELALPVEKIILEFTFVNGPVNARLFTLKALLALNIHAFISLSVVGLLPAFTMLAIIEELSLIAVLDFFVCIFALQFSLTACDSIEEHATDHRSRLSKCLGTLAMRLARDESALILVTIWPTNLTLAVRDKFLLVFRCVLAHLARID